jgi:stage III sporulation protein SpoIIIAA
MFVLYKATIKATVNQTLKAIHKCLKRMSNRKVYTHIAEDLRDGVTEAEIRRTIVGWESADKV